MSEECPLCKIPSCEFLLYEDDLVYLCRTKDLKGHQVRVMAVTKRHVQEPSFEERTLCYHVLFEYMRRVCRDEAWFIVDSTYASIPNHYHLIACDNRSLDPKELEQLHKTPRVMFPIYLGFRKVMIGIPAYNEDKTIGLVVSEARKYGDVYVVDDGSTDHTSYIAKFSGAYVIRHHKNLGYGKALQTIFQVARKNNYDVLVVLDADGQHDPTEIPRFLEALNGDVDIVCGVRYYTSEIPKLRGFTLRILDKIVGVEDCQNGFRAYNRKAINNINITETGMGASIQILQQAKQKNLQIKLIPCQVLYQKPPKRNIIQHGAMLLEALLWRTIYNHPFRYLGLPSILMFMLGFMFMTMLIQEYLAKRWFAMQLAVLTLGAFLMAGILGVATLLTWIIKRGLREI